MLTDYFFCLVRIIREVANSDADEMVDSANSPYSDGSGYRQYNPARVYARQSSQQNSRSNGDSNIYEKKKRTFYPDMKFGGQYTYKGTRDSNGALDNNVRTKVQLIALITYKIQCKLGTNSDRVCKTRNNKARNFFNCVK